MRFIIFSFFLVPFFCIAQKNTLISKSSLAASGTFQLIIPSPKYTYIYNEIVTDSLLIAINTKRSTVPGWQNTSLSLPKGLSIFILSQDKVTQGIRIPQFAIR